MKVYSSLLLIAILVIVFGCKEQPSNLETEKLETVIKVDSITKPSLDTVSVPVPKKVFVPRVVESKYVTARSGLNYRDAVQGKVFGKFSLNTYVEIIERTGVVDKVIDDAKIIKGEWVKVIKKPIYNKADTVYVFDGFLGDQPIRSDLTLYFASFYYKDKSFKESASFINVSESYFYKNLNSYQETEQDPILSKKNLERETIILNHKQRKKFLRKLGISESDTAFIYSFKNDSISTFKIKDLPVIAAMNIYGPSSDYENEEFDYQFGFKLGDTIIDDDNLAYIGKSNPFQTGQIQPLIWNKIENSSFPFEYELDKKDYKIETFSKTVSKYKLYTRNYQSEISRNYHYHAREIVVLDTVLNTIVSKRLYSSGESASLSVIYTSDESINDNSSYYQWTGALFKNKPPIIYGLMIHSFGCPSIDFIDSSEPTIEINCDNRH